MKKLVLVSVCVLSLALAGSAATKSSSNKQTPVKTEVPAAKDKQAATKSTKSTKTTAKPAAKAATPAAKPATKPTAPAK